MLESLWKRFGGVCTESLRFCLSKRRCARKACILIHWYLLLPTLLLQDFLCPQVWVLLGAFRSVWVLGLWQVTSLLSQFPDRKFVLVGDSGEKDAEARMIRALDPIGDPLKWLWVKNRYPKWNPSNWKHGPKPAVPWWFNMGFSKSKSVSPQ